MITRPRPVWNAVPARAVVATWQPYLSLDRKAERESTRFVREPTGGESAFRAGSSASLDVRVPLGRKRMMR
jgi:hypothetical protein